MRNNMLYEVRCPNKRYKGNSNNVACNTLCGRITDLSMGEFWCRKCKILFNFVINEDGDVTTFGYEETPVVQTYNKNTPEGRLLDLTS